MPTSVAAKEAHYPLGEFSLASSVGKSVGMARDKLPKAKYWPSLVANNRPWLPSSPSIAEGDTQRTLPEEYLF